MTRKTSILKIGEYNELTVSRIVEFGAYLKCDDDGDEVLLPRRYVTEDMEPGTKVKVFVYTDSEDRPVATTETPFVTVGSFAFLQTVQVTRFGAFLDWGLPKNLLVPFKEQKMKMFPGGIYLVYVYLDHNTRRVVASARIERYLGNVIPEYSPGDSVNTLVIGRDDIGYRVIVDNLHRGLLYRNEVYAPVEIGRHLKAYVKNVREDGKIDLTLTVPDTFDRVGKIAEAIVGALKAGSLSVSDKSSPEDIKKHFQCSKKDFKKAVGMLYKQHKIAISDTGEITSAKG